MVVVHSLDDLVQSMVGVWPAQPCRTSTEVLVYSSRLSLIVSPSHLLVVDRAEKAYTRAIPFSYSPLYGVHTKTNKYPFPSSPFALSP